VRACALNFGQQVKQAASASTPREREGFASTR